jgi:arylsulfatase A-like enzyme
MRVLLLVALTSWACAACGASGPPPSVILVSIDTLRADHVGLYGYPRATTPFLDRFARDATVFEHAFTTCPWTLVAHMTMLTGLFPAQHGVVRAELGLSPEVPLLAERLQHAGYQTVALYHPSWITERYGFQRGFDVFRGHQSAEEAGQHLQEELARLDRTRPFFLFYHLFDVHNGAMASGTHVIYPSPEPFQDMFLTGAAERLPKIPPDELWESENLLDADQLAALTALYDGGIRHVDTRLEEAFAWLEHEGWLANTLVIVTADHGEALGQRGRLTGHGDLAQEGLHVPLIVRHPRGKGAGTRVDAVTHLGDIVPTVLDVTGLPADPALPGRSLFGELPAGRVITGTHEKQEFVVRWPEKLIREQGVGTVRLDLERDPRELDVHPAAGELFEQLARQAYPHERACPPPLLVGTLPPAELDALRALGYGGEESK